MTDAAHEALRGDAVAAITTARADAQIRWRAAHARGDNEEAERYLADMRVYAVAAEAILSRARKHPL